MTRKNFLLRNITILSVILLTGACNNSTEKTDKKPEKKVPFVRTAIVQKSDMATFIDLTGTVRPNISSDVSAPVEGVLEKLYVRENSFIKKDELVGVISSSDRNALIASNQLKIKELENQLAKTDKTSAQFADVQQQLDKARKDYEYALSMYQTYPVVAPMSGMVTKRYADQGSQLTARQTFITITDMSSLVIKVELNEEYFSKVKQGNKIDVKLNAYPEKTFTGIISLIYPEINQATRTMILDIKLTGLTEKIIPGMMAEIKFPVEKKKDILAIPNDVILTKPNGDKFVFVVNDTTAHQRIIQTGISTKEITEVLNGLSAGENLVTLGQEMLKDNMAVKIQKQQGLKGKGKQ
jgi:RND family efflux transporter MFP subunit